MTILDSSQWRHLIPHRGSMSLLDRVLVWDAGSLHAEADSHRRGDHPLRSEGGLHAVHLIEYAAQATAVHGALRATLTELRAPAAGRLVSLRDVVLAAEYVDDWAAVLDIHVVHLLGGNESAHYQFRVEAGQQMLVSGRMAVIYGPAG